MIYEKILAFKILQVWRNVFYLIIIIFYCLAEDPSDEFIALRDLVSLELCHKYLPDLFSKESILKTERLTKEMVDKARDVCKLTKVIFIFIFFYFI